MAYVGYITTLTNVRKHSNADRLLLADCFGNTVCVNLEYKEGQVGVYFPTDGQLSVEFCEKNNLVRKKDETGKNIGGYMDPDKRNVTSIRLRGEKSDGLFLPLTCLEYTGIDLSKLTVGQTIDIVNGHEICKKYIPKRKNSEPRERGNKTRKKKVNIAPLFTEHADTEQLAYNLSAFHPGDCVEITLKMHGTSQRTAYLPVFQNFADSTFCNIKNNIRKIWAKIWKKEFDPNHNGKPQYDWGYISGTRRCVLDDYEGGFYGSNSFREKHSKFFEGKLLKGEEVYYEVVGFCDSATPIMSTVSNSKTQDKEFIKRYGKETTFSYGCTPPDSDFYIYRMTMTNEDGDIIEYDPDLVRYRASQMGAKCVPFLWRGYIPEDAENAGEYIKEIAEKFYDGPDPIGQTHVREGVVCRIINRPKFTAYKHKNFSFKVLEGIAKVEAEAPDMEEAQEATEE
jgi:hypothetical protein